MPPNQRRVLIQAAVEHRNLTGDLVVILREPQREHRCQLKDDGTAPGDNPMDGLWATACPVGQVRFVDLELCVVKGADHETLYRRVVHVPSSEDVSINFFLNEAGGRQVASRVSWLPAAGYDEYRANDVSLWLAFGWGILVLLYVGFLTYLGRR